MKRLIPGAVAELVGTFALTFIGAGAIVITTDLGEPARLLVIALAHGLILAVMVSATMHISGGQINPAVSLALLAIGKQNGRRTAVFIMAQVVGAILAAILVLYAMTPHADWNVETTRLGATLGAYTIAETRQLVPAFLLELVGAYLLMFVVIGTAVDPRGVGRGPMIGGFGIGLTLTAIILFIGPATGASVNPARSFGPALVGGHWDSHWLYWVAPILGAVLAAFTWKAAMRLPEADT